jgi:D-glycero-alpha-D-manno-heptose 1-phosphate guanylyltransferase
MKLLVLAGGFGRRLQTVVSAVPKALAPVGSVPFLHLQIEHWKNQGIKSFVFLLHYQSDLIISFLQSEHLVGKLIDCEVQWLVEPTPLDTGGAVAFAVEQMGIKGNFLVTNADTWLSSGISKVTQGKAPSLAVVKLSDATRYGQVQFDGQHRVTVFKEKNKKGQGPGWINAGLCLLNDEAFKDWDHLPFSLERVTFPAMVARRELQAVPLQTEFIDIGVPDDYYRFCSWIASDRKGTLWS